MFHFLIVPFSLLWPFLILVSADWIALFLLVCPGLDHRDKLTTAVLPRGSGSYLMYYVFMCGLLFVVGEEGHHQLHPLK
jgi:hypothetical protein